MGDEKMPEETGKRRLLRLFYGSIVEIHDGLHDLHVPEEIAQDALDRIESAISKALEHSGEAEADEEDSEDEATDEE